MLKLERIYSWRTHLTALINEKRNTVFQWGQHDCALWAADCILAITGTDLVSKGRGKYKTPAGAYKTLAKVYEADNVKEAFSKLFEEVHIAQARPGDIVYKNSNYEGFNVAVGVCYGKHSFFVVDEETSLVEVDTLSCDGAFRIG